MVRMLNELKETMGQRVNKIQEEMKVKMKTDIRKLQTDVSLVKSTQWTK